jgi:hypothetical protein
MHRICWAINEHGGYQLFKDRKTADDFVSILFNMLNETDSLMHTYSPRNNPNCVCGVCIFLFRQKDPLLDRIDILSAKMHNALKMPGGDTENGYAVNLFK